MGISIALGIFFWFGYKPERRTLRALILSQRGPALEKEGETLYSCGYGEPRAPKELGEVNISNKAQIGLHSVVNVRIDRLTLNEEGNYVWVNPKYLKVLDPKKNPTPSSPEELEGIWRESGRVMILPEKEEEQEEEENPCPKCGLPLEYSPELEDYYCAFCEIYKDEESPPEDLPPDDSAPEGPPPEDSPPDDSTPKDSPPDDSQSSTS